MALHFSTKADTLISLQGVLKSARIAPLQSFSVGDWEADSQACLSAVYATLGTGPWIVRSSCSREDGLEVSNAGALISVPDVTGEQLRAAVLQVIAAYGETLPADKILIQPMLENVIRAGVAFSHDPNTCAPYRVVNWSDGQDTAAVTSGTGGRVWQQAAGSSAPPPPSLVPVVVMLDELLDLFGGIPVDCEFAVTREGQEEVLWLLQARPLVLSSPPESVPQQTERLENIQRRIARGMHPHPFLMGRRTVYGVMPDWNPAEIVGIRPRPLALSLYRELVTDAIWAYQRHNYGYRNLRSFPLMPHFFGQPYVDVRLSFNSFIPADLDESVAGRLVDHYIDRLLSEPALHDKIEFEIVYSCYTLDLPKRLERLAEAGFSPTERQAIADSLRRLTNRVMHHESGLWRSDAAKLDTLLSRREQLLAASADPLERIYWLLEDTKRYGTLPFAGLARAGFIAVQMLRSLVSTGIFSPADHDAFLRSISTVSGQLARDRAALDRTTFLDRYGHLRPGTYDILSPRYDEAPELYFDWQEAQAPVAPPPPFALTLPQMREISRHLDSHGLAPDPVCLLDFLQAGIEQREQSKFLFSRNLSDILVLVADYGARLGFSRDDMSYCDIAAFRELYVAAADPEAILAASIAQGRERYRDTQALSLPPLITRPEDVWAFEWPATSPNFVTQCVVTAPVAAAAERNAIAGAIVCIPGADPGYDWLFSYPIAGLITAWGGANSHMAIRAGELGIPAVIGAGEQLYQRWSSARRLAIDCAGRRVDVLA
jgi:glutamine kinase